jgi:hypothetical protein
MCRNAAERPCAFRNAVVGPAGRPLPSEQHGPAVRSTFNVLKCHMQRCD